MITKITDSEERWARKLLYPKIEKALSLPQVVENAVVPIYFPLKAAQKAEQIASGVVVKIGGQYFIFCASHVFDDIGEYRVLVGVGGGIPLIQLAGTRFSTARGRSGTHKDDPIDASVFHIQSDVPPELAKVAMSFADLDLDQPDKNHSVFLIAGYRVKESKNRGNHAHSHRGCYPSQEYSLRWTASLKLDHEKHIAIGFDEQNMVDGKWQKSPLLRGVSGGAIIKVEGVSVVPGIENANKPRQLLTAIAIEHRRQKDHKPPAIIGTRIGVHLGLIRRFLPALEFS